MKKLSLLLCACVVLSGFPVTGMAGDIFGKAPEGDVSVFDYGRDGMCLGLFGGFAAGYIRYKDESDKGREIVVSGGYGTLAGAGLGLILGFVDASKGKKDIGALILRDMRSGSGFGSLIGTIWGAINALNKNDSRLLGEGSAWGYLGGAAIGVLVAYVESPKPSSSKAKIESNYGGSVVFLRDSRKNPYPALAATYSF